MLLAIDAGNTNTVFSVFRDETCVGTWRCATNGKRTADEYAVWLSQLMELQGLKRSDITGSIIATVVPDTRFNLTQLCRRYFDGYPLMIGEEGVDIGTRAVVDKPQEVGADRLVNSFAAHERFGGPLIVIDFGTATTFDVVDGEGNYRGGIIAPGINLSLEALYMAAAALPRVDIKPPPQVIGRDTISCMQSGVFWGYVSMIEGLVKRIQSEYGESLKVIATGGLAPIFAEATDAIEHIDGMLTLRGLMLIYRRNRKA